jgi:hypothetical protein
MAIRCAPTSSIDGVFAAAPDNPAVLPIQRLFFLATARLFGAQGGEEWGVSDFLLRPNRTQVFKHT